MLQCPLSLPWLGKSGPVHVFDSRPRALWSSLPCQAPRVSPICLEPLAPIPSTLGTVLGPACLSRLPDTSLQVWEVGHEGWVHLGMPLCGHVHGSGSEAMAPSWQHCLPVLLGSAVPRDITSCLIPVPAQDQEGGSGLGGGKCSWLGEGILFWRNGQFTLAPTKPCLALERGGAGGEAVSRLAAPQAATSRALSGTLGMAGRAWLGGPPDCSCL